MKIYISGQISGLPLEETKAKFSNIESELVEQGYEVINPLKNGIPYNAPWEVHIAMDILLLIGCQAIYLLPDWAYSKGSTLEKKIAEFTGKQIIYQEVPTFLDIKEAIAETMGISFVDIVGPSRERKQVYARMIFANYCREQGATVQRIADEMKHNHSTIVYYIRKYKDDYQYNPDFRERVKLVENALSKI
ncbi:MAG: DUF4406 domain-containing protein [Bacteroidales bacterium]|jgi:hypothetical protein|nr:DUF4406 domain-containing protein [Bacteroidales bacterium]